ncbi:MAG TPA: YqcC family protein [Ferruginibacter sp.]|nr:YqcC family protein [Ferruginibacter sp.]
MAEPFSFYLIAGEMIQNRFTAESNYMTEALLIAEKIKEVRDEMRSTGLWKKEVPAWVKEFEKRMITNREDFSEWLQFVYLPNRVQETESRQPVLEKIYIVPQAVKFFGNDIKKGKLLQLLIELDSLS